jgi:hypothetical protein
MAETKGGTEKERVTAHWMERYASKIDSDFISPTLTYERQRAMLSQSKQAE